MVKKEKQELTCETGLKENIINKEVFEREIALCKKLYKQGCGWGKCEECGVIPFLYKLHKGKLIEDPEKIKNIKKNIFKK
ncbi:MAG: hypothetical protein ISS87_01805 [Candidatus Pacebacteria bacterium]|nr:hypothetical protein [Candidatus Paceibacterota bacterium]